ncbi:MAG: helix-turn-helix domain-containing protein [Blautia sp.]
MKIYWNGESKNIVGERVRMLRKEQKISQRTLAARLTLTGLEFSDLTILRIEQGTRFVPDYEVAVLAEYFHVSTDYLLGKTESK